MRILYPALIEFDKNDQRYLVTFFDFDEAITEATSKEEALLNAAEVLTLTLEGRMEEGMNIPLPSKHSKAELIAPSLRVQSALLLRLARGSLTTAKLARSLNTSWAAVARLEDPHHWPSLKQVEKAAKAIGQRVVLSFEPL